MGPDVIIPAMVFAIPIVAILTNHQRKMAELIHGGQMRQDVDQEIGALRAEVGQLRSLVNTQAMAIDSMAQLRRSENSTDASGLTNRLR